MDANETGRVLIAGGGIAGLAVRRALALRNVPSLTLERRGRSEDGGLAINLPGNAVQALARLGLAEAMRAVGRPVRRREYRTERDRLLFAVDEAAFWGEALVPHCLRRADLLRLLGQDLPPDDLIAGRAVAAIHPEPGGITVACDDGDIVRGGLLVGADGVRSGVRRALFGEAAPQAATLASASWRFMAPDPGLDAWTVWAGAGALFLLIPVERGTVYGWASVADATGRDLRAARGAFAGFPRPVRDTLDAALERPDAIHHSPLEEIRIPHWSAGRVVLAGDAAHATAPVWAQGAALALEDALVLADCLAGCTDWSGIGPAYETRRRPRVAHVQAMTDRMSRASQLPGWARRILLPVIGPRSYRATYAPLRAPVIA
ncbi:FAD-dependent monooxygenase [Methylorubrum salsuginis]|uniref:2-polyprenyl-6-methoxyphenol hydroxylase n=1 Tax=Methylorubrum salsuginis TaxID=414703 RepID=A0A1I3Y5V4_9HYPH|nr:FAD-dependent monooxygenase [Methylorubrum salsuginis]SFK27080.1 2-polyprenyl-6-methoxyphenol hydroxylase [Methylorubrum salsuginis]